MTTEEFKMFKDHRKDCIKADYQRWQNEGVEITLSTGIKVKTKITEEVGNSYKIVYDSYEDNDYFFDKDRNKIKISKQEIGDLIKKMTKLGKDQWNKRNDLIDLIEIAETEEEVYSIKWGQ